MKRFKERIIILHPEQETMPDLFYLNSIAFWFPIKTAAGTEIKYWKGRIKTIEQDDEHISGIIKLLIKNEKI